MYSGSHFCAQAASLMRKIKADQQQMLLVKSLKTTARFPFLLRNVCLAWLSAALRCRNRICRALKASFRESLAGQNCGHTGPQEEECTRKTNFNVCLAQTSRWLRKDNEELVIRAFHPKIRHDFVIIYSLMSFQNR